MHICCICDKPYEGHGNNAQPIKEGKCCDYCNAKVVMPARTEELKENLE